MLGGVTTRAPAFAQRVGRGAPRPEVGEHPEPCTAQALEGRTDTTRHEGVRGVGWAPDTGPREANRQGRCPPLHTALARHSAPEAWLPGELRHLTSRLTLLGQRLRCQRSLTARPVPFLGAPRASLWDGDLHPPLSDALHERLLGARRNRRPSLPQGRAPGRWPQPRNAPC